MKQNSKKISVSPIIYNNGNRKLTLKIDNREVCIMQDNFIINDELKDLILKDDNLTMYFLIALLHNVYKSDNPKEHEYFTKNEYDALKSLLESDKNLHNSLLSALDDILNNDVINDVVKEYKELHIIEGIHLIETLSRLLYMQDKYKDEEIGQKIDTKIKEWLDIIKEWHDKELKQNKGKLEELKKGIVIYKAKIFHNIIPSLNYDIFNNDKFTTPFMDLWNYDVAKMETLHDYLLNMINNSIRDSETYTQYIEDINGFINSIENDINMANFERDNEDLIKQIKVKHNVVSDEKGNHTIPHKTEQAFFDELISELLKYEETNGFKIQDNEDVKKWHKKSDTFIEHLINYDGIALYGLFTMDYTLDHLAYNDYQKKAYKLDLEDDIKVIDNKKTQETQIKKDNKLLQATSKQLKAIDNARGGLVTYNETDTQALRNAIKEKQESLKNTHIKQDKARLKQEIAKLNVDLTKAEQKEKELKDEYKNVCDYLENIYKSMANEPKTSSYYKDLKKAKKEQEQRKKEIERIIQFNGWQLDLWGNGNYELVINKRKKESLKLTIENLSKQIAKYTKEEQDIFDYLVSKYLHNTDVKEVRFTLREYENIKGRANINRQLTSDINAIRLLFREVWTYITTDDKTYSFNEKHLFNNLTIKGELESDLNNLNNANLDTEISLELTETLQKLLKDHDNYLYISTPMEILQLNNDNEYLAKRLIKYLNYLARVNKKSVIDVSLDAIIEDLQHYGLKKFNMLDRHKTYKTEIVDVIEKTLNILEGENHLNKAFIEVLDRQPFINYDNDFRGKSQETSINGWGKHKIKIKVFNLDDNKLLDTKEKHNKKHKATKK